MVKLGLEKADKPEIKLSTSIGSLKKQETWRKKKKKLSFCFIEYIKAFDCMDNNKLWKILKRMGYQNTLTAFWEICMQVKKQPLEPDMEKQTGSK